MFRLVRELIRPYRWQLAVILLAMLVEPAASLAGPWPLKIIIDSVVGSHKMSPWLDHLVRAPAGGRRKITGCGIGGAGFCGYRYTGRDRNLR